MSDKPWVPHRTFWDFAGHEKKTFAGQKNEIENKKNNMDVEKRKERIQEELKKCHYGLTISDRRIIAVFFGYLSINGVREKKNYKQDQFLKEGAREVCKQDIIS